MPISLFGQARLSRAKRSRQDVRVIHYHFPSLDTIRLQSEQKPANAHIFFQEAKKYNCSQDGLQTQDIRLRRVSPKLRPPIFTRSLLKPRPRRFDARQHIAIPASEFLAEHQPITSGFADPQAISRQPPRRTNDTRCARRPNSFPRCPSNLTDDAFQRTRTTCSLQQPARRRKSRKRRPSLRPPIQSDHRLPSANIRPFMIIGRYHHLFRRTRCAILNHRPQIRASVARTAKDRS